MNNSLSDTNTNSSSNSATTNFCQSIYQKIIAFLNNGANQFPPLFLRLILAYEFWEAGIMKFEGKNWFEHITFPLPFNLLSNDVLWAMGTWFELIGAIALLLGLGTRFFTISLIVLTLVAINTVHWSSDWNTLSGLWQGYAITNKGHGNFKLPLLYLIMFMPLLFGGAGKWSLDYALNKYIFSKQHF